MTRPLLYPEDCPDCGHPIFFQEVRLLSGYLFKAEALCLRCKLEITCRPDGTLWKTCRRMARTLKGRRVAV